MVNLSMPLPPYTFRLTQDPVQHTPFSGQFWDVLSHGVWWTSDTYKDVRIADWSFYNSGVVFLEVFPQL